MGRGDFFHITAVFSALLSFLAATTAPAPVAEVRLLSFDSPRLEVSVEDREGKVTPLVVYSHTLTHGVNVRCHEGRLTLFREGKDAEGKPTRTPLASATVPPEGGTFLGIVQGSGDTLGLALIPDTGNRVGGGSMRFFNLCNKPLGLNFPGLRQVLAPGKDLVLKPDVQPSDYGQGQFLLVDGEEWKVAGGIRWLHLDDIRTFWFVLMDPGMQGVVRVRGIEERIDVTPLPPPATTTAAKPKGR